MTRAAHGARRTGHGARRTANDQRRVARYPISFLQHSPRHRHPLQRQLRVLVALGLAVTACSHPAKTEEAPAPMEQPLRPLSQLAAQRVIVTPAFAVVTGDVLGWSTTIPRWRDWLKLLDEEIATTLGDRGLKSQWMYPADLVRAQRTNPTYAVDPYTLGVNVLRAPKLASGDRLGDPLATQLRTMIALQSDARAVLVPVEVKFEKAGTNLGVATLRVVLLDGRLGDVRWVGTVRSDTSSTLSRAVLTSLAAHFADLIATP